MRYANQFIFCLKNSDSVANNDVTEKYGYSDCKLKSRDHNTHKIWLSPIKYRCGPFSDRHLRHYHMKCCHCKIWSLPTHFL